MQPYAMQNSMQGRVTFVCIYWSKIVAVHDLYCTAIFKKFRCNKYHVSHNLIIRRNLIILRAESLRFKSPVHKGINATFRQIAEFGSSSPFLRLQCHEFSQLQRWNSRRRLQPRWRPRRKRREWNDWTPVNNPPARPTDPSLIANES